MLQGSCLHCTWWQEAPEYPVPLHFWEWIPLPACSRLCCLQLSLLGAVSLSQLLLSVWARRTPLTHCVLSSAVLKPPGRRSLPRGISVSAGAAQI